MKGRDMQWGRYAEVAFTNFDTGVITEIKSSQVDPNNGITAEGLRIAFEYTKNDDQGFNTPNGKLTIYGLTDKTFSALGERLRCEIEVKAGYLHSRKNAPRQIIYAVMMEKNYEIVDGLSVSTFSLLGNFVKKTVGQRMSSNLPKPTLVEIMIAISDKMGKGFAMRINKPSNESQMLANYLEKWTVSPYGYSFANTPQEELKRLRDSFGISHTVEKDMVVFSFLESQYQRHLDRATQITEIEKSKANNILVAENKSAPETVDTKPMKSEGKKIDVVETHSVFLSPDTGLIGTPKLGNPIVRKDHDSELAKGEEVWERKGQKVLVNKKTGEAVVDKETGKEKLSKAPKHMKVSRRTVTAKCLINSMIDFDTLVTIDTNSKICDGLYRVRSVKINGDTDGSDWYMEMELNE